MELIDNIIFCNVSVLKYLLFLPIISFLTSILTMLLSHYYSAKTMNYLQYGHNVDGKKYESKVKKLNIISPVSLIIAICFSIIILLLGVFYG